MSHEFIIPGWNPVTLRFDVVNVFDTSYVIRNGSGIGVFATQYGPRRGYYFGLAQKFGPGAAVAQVHSACLCAGSRSDRRGVDLDRLLYRRQRRLQRQQVHRPIHSTATISAIRCLQRAPRSSTTARSAAARSVTTGRRAWRWRASKATWCSVTSAQRRARLPRSDLQSGHHHDRRRCAGGLVHQHNLDWFGTVRGRLGAAVTPDTLIYATGGLAFGEVEHVGTIYGSASISYRPRMPMEIRSSMTTAIHSPPPA